MSILVDKLVSFKVKLGRFGGLNLNALSYSRNQQIGRSLVWTIHKNDLGSFEFPVARLCIWATPARRRRKFTQRDRLQWAGPKQLKKIGAARG